MTEIDNPETPNSSPICAESCSAGPGREEMHHMTAEYCLQSTAVGPDIVNHDLCDGGDVIPELPESNQIADGYAHDNNIPQTRERLFCTEKELFETQLMGNTRAAFNLESPVRDTDCYQHDILLRPDSICQVPPDSNAEAFMSSLRKYPQTARSSYSILLDQIGNRLESISKRIRSSRSLPRRCSDRVPYDAIRRSLDIQRAKYKNKTIPDKPIKSKENIDVDDNVNKDKDDATNNVLNEDLQDNSMNENIIKVESRISEKIELDNDHDKENLNRNISNDKTEYNNTNKVLRNKINCRSADENRRSGLSKQYKDNKRQAYNERCIVNNTLQVTRDKRNVKRTSQKYDVNETYDYLNSPRQYLGLSPYTSRRDDSSQNYVQRSPNKASRRYSNSPESKNPTKRIGKLHKSKIKNITSKGSLIINDGDQKRSLKEFNEVNVNDNRPNRNGLKQISNVTLKRIAQSNSKRMNAVRATDVRYTDDLGNYVKDILESIVDDRAVCTKVSKRYNEHRKNVQARSSTRTQDPAVQMLAGSASARPVSAGQVLEKISTYPRAQFFYCPSSISQMSPSASQIPFTDSQTLYPIFQTPCLNTPAPSSNLVIQITDSRSNLEIHINDSQVLHPNSQVPINTRQGNSKTQMTNSKIPIPFHKPHLPAISQLCMYPQTPKARSRPATAPYSEYYVYNQLPPIPKPRKICPPTCPKRPLPQEHQTPSSSTFSLKRSLAKMTKNLFDSGGMLSNFINDVRHICAGIYTPCACEDINGVIDAMIEQAVLEWIDQIPVTSSSDCDDRAAREQLVNKLINRLQELKLDDSFNKRADKEIQATLNNMNIWYPTNYDPKSFRYHITELLMNKIKNIFEKKNLFDKIVFSWCDELPLKRFVNKKHVDRYAIQEDIVGKLWPIAMGRPIKDMDYKDNLNNEIKAILRELPLDQGEDKREDAISFYAEKLSNNLVLLPIFASDNMDKNEQAAKDLLASVYKFKILNQLDKRKAIKQLAEVIKDLTYALDDQEHIMDKAKCVGDYIVEIILTNEILKDNIKEVIKEWVDQTPLVNVNKSGLNKSIDALDNLLVDIGNRNHSDDVFKFETFKEISNWLDKNSERVELTLENQAKTIEDLVNKIIDTYKQTEDEAKGLIDLETELKDIITFKIDDTPQLTDALHNKDLEDLILTLTKELVKLIYQKGINSEDDKDKARTIIENWLQTTLYKENLRMMLEDRKSLLENIFQVLTETISSAQENGKLKMNKEIEFRRILDTALDNIPGIQSKENHRINTIRLAKKLANIYKSKDFLVRAKPMIFDWLDSTLALENAIMTLKNKANYIDDLETKLLDIANMCVNQDLKDIDKIYARKIEEHVKEIAQLEEILKNKFEKRRIEDLAKKLNEILKEGFEDDEIKNVAKEEILRWLSVLLETGDLDLQKTVKMPDFVKNMVNKVVDDIIYKEKELMRKGLLLLDLKEEFQKAIITYLKKFPDLSKSLENNEDITSIKKLAYDLVDIEKKYLPDKEHGNEAITKVNDWITQHLRAKQINLSLGDKSKLINDIFNILNETAVKADVFNLQAGEIDKVIKKEMTLWANNIPAVGNALKNEGQKQRFQNLVDTIIKLEKINLTSDEYKNMAKLNIRQWLDTISNNEGLKMSRKVKNQSAHEAVAKLESIAEEAQKLQLRVGNIENALKKVIANKLVNIPEIVGIAKDIDHKQISDIAKELADIEKEGNGNKEINTLVGDKIINWLDTLFENEDEKMSAEIKSRIVNSLTDGIMNLFKKSEMLQLQIGNVESPFKKEVLESISNTPQFSKDLKNKIFQESTKSLVNSLVDIYHEGFQDDEFKDKVKIKINNWLKARGRLPTNEKPAFAEDLSEKLSQKAEKAETLQLQDGNCKKPFKKLFKNWIRNIPEISNINEDVEHKKNIKNLANTLAELGNEIGTSSAARNAAEDKIREWLDNTVNETDKKMSSKKINKLVENVLNTIGEKVTKAENLELQDGNLGSAFQKQVKRWFKDLSEISNIVDDIKGITDIPRISKEIKDKENEKSIKPLVKSLVNLYDEGHPDNEFKDKAKTKITNWINTQDKFLTNETPAFADDLSEKLSQKADKAEILQLQDGNCKQTFNKVVKNWIRNIPEISNIVEDAEHQKSVQNLVNTLSGLGNEIGTSGEARNVAENKLKEWLDNTLNENDKEINSKKRNKLVQAVLNTIGDKVTKADNLELQDGNLENAFHKEIKRWSKDLPGTSYIVDDKNGTSQFSKDLKDKQKEKSIKPLAKSLVNLYEEGHPDKEFKDKAKTKITNWIKKQDTISTKETPAFADDLSEKLSQKADKAEILQLQNGNCKQTFNKVVKNWIRNIPEISNIVEDVEHQKSVQNLVNTLSELGNEIGNSGEARNVAENKLKEWLDNKLNEGNKEINYKKRNNLVQNVLNTIGDKVLKAENLELQDGNLESAFQKEIKRWSKDVSGTSNIIDDKTFKPRFSIASTDKNNVKSIKPLAKSLVNLYDKGFPDKEFKDKAKNKINNWLNKQGGTLGTNKTPVLADGLSEKLLQKADKAEILQLQEGNCKEPFKKLVKNWIRNIPEISDILEDAEYQKSIQSLVDTLAELGNEIGANDKAREKAEKNIRMWLDNTLNGIYKDISNKNRNKLVQNLLNTIRDKVRKAENFEAQGGNLEDELQKDIIRFSKDISELSDIVNDKEHQRTIKDLSNLLTALKNDDTADQETKKEILQEIRKGLDVTFNVKNRLSRNLEDRKISISEKADEMQSLDLKIRKLISQWLRDLPNKKQYQKDINEFNEMLINLVKNGALKNQSARDKAKSYAKNLLETILRNETPPTPSTYPQVDRLFEKLDEISGNVFKYDPQNKIKDKNNVKVNEASINSPDTITRKVSKLLINEAINNAKDTLKNVGNNIDRNNKGAFLRNSMSPSVMQIVFQAEVKDFAENEVGVHMNKMKIYIGPIKELAKSIVAVERNTGLSNLRAANNVKNNIRNWLDKTIDNENLKTPLVTREQLSDKLTANLAEWAEKLQKKGAEYVIIEQSIKKDIKNWIDYLSRFAPSPKQIKIQNVTKELANKLTELETQIESPYEKKSEEKAKNEIEILLNKILQSGRLKLDDFDKDVMVDSLFNTIHVTSNTIKEKRKPIRPYKLFSIDKVISIVRRFFPRKSDISSDDYDHRIYDFAERLVIAQATLENKNFPDIVYNETKNFLRNIYKLYDRRLSITEEDKDVKSLADEIMKVFDSTNQMLYLQPDSISKDRAELTSGSNTSKQSQPRASLKDKYGNESNASSGKNSTDVRRNPKRLLPNIASSALLISPVKAARFKEMINGLINKFTVKSEGIIKSETDKVDDLVRKLASVMEDIHLSNVDKKSLLHDEVGNFLKPLILDTHIPIKRLESDLVEKIISETTHMPEIISSSSINKAPSPCVFKCLQSQKEIVDDTDPISVNENRYKNQLLCIIDNWTQYLPLIQDALSNTARRKEVVEDLSNDILDRQRYLQINPEAKTTNEEELEHLKYNVYRWLNKNFGINDLTQFQPCIVDLMNRLQLLPVVSLLRPSSKPIQEEILKFVNQAPVHIKTIKSSDEIEKVTKQLADKILRDRGKSDPDLCIEKDIALWLPTVFRAEKLELNKMGHSLKNILKQKGLLNRRLDAKFRKATDVLYDAIKEWCNALPIYADETFETEENVQSVKQNLASKLINKTAELNLNPEIFNDDFLYDNILTDEIDKIIDGIPSTTELEMYLPTLKKDLISQIKETRLRIIDEIAGHVYKHQLRDTLTKTLCANCLPINEMASFELLKDKLVDAFINLNYSMDNKENKLKYKKKISDEVLRFCNDYLRRYPGRPLKASQLNSELMSALTKIPVPKDETMMNEVEQLRIKDLINDWMQDLPLKEPDTISEIINRSKMISLLAKRLFELEKEKESNPLIDYNNRMRVDIERFLKKVPVKKGYEGDIPPLMTDALIDMMRVTGNSRRFVAEYETPDDSCIGCRAPVPILSSTLTKEDRAHMNRIKGRVQLRKSKCRDASITTFEPSCSSQVDNHPWCPFSQGNQDWDSPPCPDNALSLSYISPSQKQTRNASTSNSSEKIHVAHPNVIVREYGWNSTCDRSCSAQVDSADPVLQYPSTQHNSPHITSPCNQSRLVFYPDCVCIPQNHSPRHSGTNCSVSRHVNYSSPSSGNLQRYSNASRPCISCGQPLNQSKGCGQGQLNQYRPSLCSFCQQQDDVTQTGEVNQSSSGEYNDIRKPRQPCLKVKDACNECAASRDNPQHSCICRPRRILTSLELHTKDQKCMKDKCVKTVKIVTKGKRKKTKDERGGCDDECPHPSHLYFR